MFWVGSRWNEPAAESADQERLASGALLPIQQSGWAMACAVMVLALGTHAWVSRLDAAATDTDPPMLALPKGATGWWADTSRTALRWMPGYANPSIAAFRSYVSTGAVVDVWIGYYVAQTKDRKLVSSMHGVLSNEGRTWRALSTGVRSPSQGLPAFSTTVVSEGLSPSLSATRRERVWQAYWLNGRWIVRPAEAKLWQALDRLLGRGDGGAVLLFVTPMSDSADAILEEFTRANLADIGRALDAARLSP
jgi:EpsI family protein